jgi:hypothetical protein
MLRIRLEVKANRPKEFVPVKYEYTNGVVSSEQLQGKTLYYTVQNVYKSSSLAGSFRLYTARKFDASHKFNGEVKVTIMLRYVLITPFTIILCEKVFYLHVLIKKTTIISLRLLTKQ